MENEAATDSERERCLRWLEHIRDSYSGLRDLSYPDKLLLNEAFRTLEIEIEGGNAAPKPLTME